jgi:hypothetical protein
MKAHSPRQSPKASAKQPPKAATQKTPKPHPTPWPASPSGPGWTTQGPAVHRPCVRICSPRGD